MYLNVHNLYIGVSFDRFFSRKKLSIISRNDSSLVFIKRCIINIISSTKFSSLTYTNISYKHILIA
uniref:Uncharacterized protein n=1 Tax=Lepeophtheirus salmonis TaxID=72036 RepID=A0A0K2SZD5_LEPSM